MFTLNNISFGYKLNNPIFDGVNISFPKGINLIVAENGEGKTTLFYLLMGLLKPTIGDIFYHGEKYRYDRAWLANFRGKVGFMFQNPEQQIFAFRVKDDVGLGLKLRGLDSRTIEHKVKDILERLGIAELYERDVDQLSFGQKKKVALAGLMVLEPDFYIFDEPFANIDKKGRSFLIDFLSDIKKAGKSAIVSSHEFDLHILEIVDKVFMIENKQIFPIKIEECIYQSDFLKINIEILKKYGYDKKLLDENIFLSVKNGTKL